MKKCTKAALVGMGTASLFGIAVVLLVSIIWATGTTVEHLTGSRDIAGLASVVTALMVIGGVVGGAVCVAVARGDEIGDRISDWIAS